LLSKFCLTPQQWRDLDIRDANFLVAAFNEENRREVDRQKRLAAQRRHS
jgi:hypothetical protein